MTIVGYQFDMAEVTADNDASYLATLDRDRSYIVPNRGNGMNVTSNGLVLTIDTGQANIQGRRVEIIEPHSVPIPINAIGYLAIVIDLSKMNESNGKAGTIDYKFTNNQLTVEFVEDLTFSDLNNGGLINTFPLGKATSNLTNATFIKDDNAYRSVTDDCDKLVSGGLYYCDGTIAINSPYLSESVSYFLGVNRDRGLIVQKSYPFNASYPPYYRTFDGSVWSDWRGYI